ncbi:PH protein [Venustampulla echinocandica]|uniref:PH protein n=1 Tax=Venustampulla echinocandica TaxID=2656787 RepID=A0A370TM24_9HELO|nr:PH protein [Venustampulla echinocandica]RDL36567.1 PH protein [Venustampulla echinocandica]
MAETTVSPGSHPVTMPLRQASGVSTGSDQAVPTSDPKDTSELLAERLQAWKHAVGYLEDYVSATEKVEKAHAKEYEKVLKSIQNPLREGHHFDQNLGGVANLFENMRQNTQGLANTHLETEKNLKGSVLPILERLHKEIKNKAKELASGAAKSAKEVEKARNSTQKHIEMLGQHTASFESTGGKMHAEQDPYVIRRGVLHRLSQQVMFENNHRHDVISVQNNFAQFEAHILEVIQQALMSFNQFVTGQAQRQQELYSDMLASAVSIPPDFEWTRFSGRNSHILIDPSSPDRTVEGTSFANQEHKSTKAVIEGTLERKSRNKLSFSGYSTGYYVVTPSKFLHEFKDNDNLRHDATPELTIFLPDATIGTPSGEKFNVKGKDVSKGIGSKLSGSSEVQFKAHTAADAQNWFDVIRSVVGSAPSGSYSGSTPTSPISPVDTKTPAPLQTQLSGVTTGQTIASPATATPVSAVGKTATAPVGAEKPIGEGKV